MRSSVVIDNLLPADASSDASQVDVRAIPVAQPYELEDVIGDLFELGWID